MGFFKKDEKENKELSRSDRIEQGQLHTRMIIEMLGKPKEHMEKTFNDLLAKFSKEEGIVITNKTLSKTKKQGEMFSRFAEISFWAKNLSKIIGICFDYMPSSVEINEPDKVVWEVNYLNGYINELQAKLHHVDMLAKQAETEKSIIASNFLKLMENSIMVAVANGQNTNEKISKMTGISQEVLEQSIGKLLQEKKLEKKVKYMQLPDDDLKKKAEALLFSIGKRIEINEMAKHLRCKDLDQLEKVLKEIQLAYEERQSPMFVVNEGAFWKIVVREKYHPVVKKVVADIELSKTLMETLALVAWKNPVKQSEIIEARSNKGYDHLDELERMGFITRKKYGRTKLIALTEKFFNYFELSGHEDIKDAFKRIKEIEEKKMQEYAEKKALADIKRQKSQETQVINQKAFLERIDRKLEKESSGSVGDGGQEKPKEADLEEDIKQEEERQEDEFEKKIEESSDEAKKGLDEEEKDEDYDEKLDLEGMPNLDEDEEDEEEELLDEEKEEKKK